ncbi:hypothetical protein [Mesorhizobium sp.]|uniref:hypothetical protein n=1 Tax=Mesorhizobium sp. TaxID=1871066 RepID=UPI002634378A|nr:hypothetical protein [Mesorhizobium sp.]
MILTIHWHEGQHSQVRKSGEHGQRTPEQALEIMRSMETRWSDAEIAATLNRMACRPVGERPGPLVAPNHCGQFRDGILPADRDARFALPNPRQ